MKTLVACVLAVIPLAASAQMPPTPSLAGLPNHPFLYVEGEARIEKAPDLILLDLDITAHNADQGKANQEVQVKAKKIFAILKGAHIKDSDVVAQEVVAEEDYERDDPNQRKRGKLIGYIVTRPFKVTIRDVTKYGQLGDEIMNIGGITLEHIGSEVSDRDKLGEELWPKAIANAREKAEKTLKPMGMKIDSVFAVSSIAFGEVTAQFLRGGEEVIVTGMNVPTPPDKPSQYRLEMVPIVSAAHVIYFISPAN